MKKQDYIELIPIAILAIIGIYSIIEVATTAYVFGIKQHIGLRLMVISVILFFANRKIYRYFFGIILLMGLFNLIGFTTTINTITLLGLLPIQVILLPIVMIFIWINKEKITSKKLDIFGQQEGIALENTSKISGFKRRFEKLSDSQIDSKINENLIPEAIEALKQLKKEREKSK